MFRPKILTLVFAFFLVQPSPALTVIPDLSHSEASIAYEGPGIPSLLVVPDGNGNSFTEAHDEQGNLVDATITLIVKYSTGAVVENYPFEDLWLQTVDDGLIPCIRGTVADQNTDSQGMTQWVRPLRAGGNSLGPVRIFISGMFVIGDPGLPLKFNSPDANGDLVVNLQDIQILGGDYFTGYNFRCDLNGDGYVNLGDIPIFAQHLEVQCP